MNIFARPTSYHGTMYEHSHSKQPEERCQELLSALTRIKVTVFGHNNSEEIEEQFRISRFDTTLPSIVGLVAFVFEPAYG